MRLLNIILIGTTICFLASCKDDEKEGCTDPISVSYDPEAKKDDGSCAYAGTGGGVEVVVFPQYNNQAVISTASYPDTAYVKFNSVTFPGASPSAYDMVIPGNDGENHLHAFFLKKGKYFIFVTGWDVNTNKRVAGGLPLTVTQESGVVNVTIPTMPSN